MASGITRTGILCGLYLGVFATAVPVWLYVVGTRAVGPSRAAIITTLEPVVAMLAGIALLGEGLYWYVVAGCLLVVGGIVLVSRART
jgi:drug/metabolite transporter (DMT)-like permease